MSLVKCEECGREVSSSARVCPHCGAKSSRTRYNEAASYIIMAIIVLGVGGYCFFN